MWRSLYIIAVVASATAAYGDESFWFKNDSPRTAWVWVQEYDAANYRRPSIKVRRGEGTWVKVQQLAGTYLAVRDDRNVDNILGFVRPVAGYQGSPTIDYRETVLVTYKPVFETKTRQDQWGRTYTYQVHHFVPEHRLRGKSLYRGLDFSHQR